MRARNFLLVAEDDDDDRFLMQNIFKELNYDIPLEFVYNGVELIEYLDKVKSNKDGMHYPSLILLDLNMPKMDGRQALHKLKGDPEYKKLPVIIFSTTKNQAEIKKCYELGANSYIIKPSTYELLSKTIDSIRNYWLATVSLPV